MNYMLLIYGDQEAMAHATPEQNQAVADEYEAFTQSIRGTGQFLDGDPFLPTTTAKTVQGGTGGLTTNDGPAVASAPQLMAYYKVSAADDAAAVELAQRVPGAKYGAVEVRPIMQFD
jgi:hypothetical protein